MAVDAGRSLGLERTRVINIGKQGTSANRHESFKCAKMSG